MLLETILMEIVKDRYVIPSFIVPETAKGAAIIVPALNDASAIYIQTALHPHRFNYYHDFNEYASDGIMLEFDFDDDDGTTHHRPCQQTGCKRTP
jgi:hypothetical protein